MKLAAGYTHRARTAIRRYRRRIEKLCRGDVPGPSVDRHRSRRGLPSSGWQVYRTRRLQRAGVSSTEICVRMDTGPPILYCSKASGLCQLGREGAGLDVVLALVQYKYRHM